MYCPSCDKSYGAVHSRCPECHSWLKVSAPANSRAKTAKSNSTAAEGGRISTLDKEPTAWAGSSASPGTDWDHGGDDAWSDALPSSLASASPSLSADPAPVAGAWGAASSSDSWGGVDPVAKVPKPSPQSTSSQGGGWLDGEDAWGSQDNGFSTPSSLGSSSARGMGDSAADGWGGGAGLGSSSAAKTPGLGSSFGEDDDWGSGGGLGSSRGSGVKSSVPAPSQGWLGGEPAGGISDEPAAGWLGGSEASSAPSIREGDGWLGGDEPVSSPSMTEMVDRAIGVEEADDFVDDSWVDEIDNDEFGELGDASESYASPTPEVGGVFLKMLLVAVLVIMVGGGVMFMGQETKTPEQIAAEELAKELEFARSSVQMGKDHLQAGQPLLAIGPLEAAMTALKTTGATEKEILDTKAELARALMKAQEYQKSYDHWAGLAKGPEEYRKEARAQMAECSKLLRLQANQQLVEAADYIKAGESASVTKLGQSSLKIYEQHQGSASQKGRAHGVIGRGYLNGKEYGKARDSLKKALALNPAGGYQADLNKIAQLTAPVDYYGGYSAPAAAAPAQPSVVEVRASIDTGDPGYAVSSYRSGGGGGGRSASSASSAAPIAAPAPSRPQTREIPAYRPSSSSSGSSGQRKGSKDVLRTY